jgi:cytidyltransferase-like protein
MREDKIVAVSGGFDPLHKGHVALIQGAAEYGRVHVYLNTDEWLTRKKGYVFMSWQDRAAILMALKGVELVIPVIDKDDTVCETIRTFKPDIFCNGGDRLPDNTPELVVCGDLGIQVKFNIGGEKIESSSGLVKRVKNEA